jgi:DNA mismatch repair protein MutL
VVKHALAQFSITPTLDFELDASIQQLDAISKPFTEEKQSAASSSSLYKTFTQKNQAHFIENKSELRHWKDFYESDDRGQMTDDSRNNQNDGKLLSTDNRQLSTNLTQLHNTFILLQTDKGFRVVHQQNAHERILYERFAAAFAGKPIATQQSLFPATLNLPPADAVVLNELLPDLNELGYHIEPFGNNAFVVQGTPADIEQGSETVAIEKMLEQYKHFSNDLKFSKREKLFRSLAWQQSVKAGTALSQKEMQSLIEELFACATPNTTPNGKPTYTEFNKNELDKIFGR